MTNRKHPIGFTLVELLVVISIIALLLAILLPSLAKARQTAQKTISQTQLRGIHQAFFSFAQGNNNLYPGLVGLNDRDAAGSLADGGSTQTFDWTGYAKKAGAYPGCRFIIAMEGGYFPAKYLISPGEISKTITDNPWDITKGRVYKFSTMFYSYALPRISNDVSKNNTMMKGLMDGWQANASGQVLFASDRLVKYSDGVTVPATSSTHRSIWSPADQPGSWEGALCWNDGSVVWQRGSTVDGPFLYDGVSSTNNNIFAGNGLNGYGPQQIVRQDITALWSTDP